MPPIDDLIQSLIESERRASADELAQIVEHVRQASFSSRILKLNRWLRQELEDRGVEIPARRLPSVEIHLLKRIHLDKQWTRDTIASQFVADLHLAVSNATGIWTYRWLGEAYAGFLAPSHVQNVTNSEAFIFVVYSADYGVIKTGFQASGPEAIFTKDFESLVRHR